MFRHRIGLLGHRKCWFLLALLAFTGCVVRYVWKRHFIQETQSIFGVQDSHRNRIPHIIWWTHMPNNYESLRFCGMRMCHFSSSRGQLDEASAVLFYASQIEDDDIPLPRQLHQKWGLLHEESPRNVAMIRNAVVLQYFNLTATFSRESDFPLTTQYLNSREALTTPKYMVPIGQKSLYRRNDKLAAVVFMQSDCDTMSGRDEYVKQLMEHIKVDSYGHCLQNRDLPHSLTVNYLNKLYEPELLHFLARYKFVLSYENGICYDYITEKFWRPLVVGSIPVYFGSPSIADWQPNPKSVIHISNFSSPKALADFLHQLDRNDTEYNSYLNHKFNMIQPITNNRLLEDLKNREYNTDVEGEGIFGAFECFVCRQLYDRPRGWSQVATVKHYDCPVPIIRPSMDLGTKKDSINDWHGIMSTGECIAKVLDKLWRLNRNYTKITLQNELKAHYNTGLCQ